MFDIEEMSISGYFKDDNLKIGCMLENPINYGLDESKIYFSIEAISYSKDKLDESDLTFYIIGKNNQIYNEVLRIDVECESYGEDNQLNGNSIKTLVAFEFYPDFLYNGTLIGFYYEPYNRIEFLEI